MPGFLVANTYSKSELINQYPEKCISEDLNLSDKTFKRNTLNKFLNDKTLSQTDDFITVLEGVILNKSELFELYHTTNIEELIAKTYEEKGETFFAEFKGGFSGTLYDKEKDKWIIFTNHLGNYPLFYYYKDGLLCAGTQINYILDFLKEKGKPITFNEFAAYNMLTYGFMEGADTYACEINRLLGGQYIVFENGNFEIKTFFKLHKNPDRFANMSENEIIEELDVQFRKAVELEYAKDTEYGKKHLTDISGGLDSRMNMWVSHSIKDRNLQLISYGQSDCVDEKISKKLAHYWNDEFLYKSLNSGQFLYDVDEIIKLNFGLGLYCGITGGKRLLEQLNTDIYGLEHTGMNGDSVIGSYCKKTTPISNPHPIGKYSDRLSHRLSHNMLSDYDDCDLYLLFSRGINGMTSTYLIRNNFTDAVSPFEYIDFFQLCMDIPLELRVHHNIYRKWIINKYPEAAKFKWEKFGSKISKSYYAMFLKKATNIGLKRILHKAKIFKRHSSQMVPFDDFVANNPKIKDYMDNYEKTGYSFLPDTVSKTLIDDMHYLYSTGNYLEKFMVLTVLSSAKLYFNN